MMEKQVNDQTAFRLVLGGGGDFNDYTLLKEKVDELLARRIASTPIVIISDLVRGWDGWVNVMRQKWVTRLPSSPQVRDDRKVSVIERNRQICDFADACICFWDSRSNYCRHLMATARKAGLQLTVVSYP